MTTTTTHSDFEIEFLPGVDAKRLVLVGSLQVFVGGDELLARQGGELGPIDVVVLNPLLTNGDHLESDVFPFQIAIQPKRCGELHEGRN